MLTYSTQCIGGPLDGRVVTTDIKPEHGRTVVLTDWNAGPDVRLSPLPTFSPDEEIFSQVEKRYDYKYVIFSQDDRQIYVLSHGTDNGLAVIRRLLDKARLKCNP